MSFLAFSKHPVSVPDFCLKPRPNDGNIPMQHIATRLNTTCCIYLATLSQPCRNILRHLARCWLKFENGQIFRTTVLDVAYIMLFSFGHVRAALLRFSNGTSSIFYFKAPCAPYNMLQQCCVRQCCNMLRTNVACLWPAPSQHDPTML